MLFGYRGERVLEMEATLLSWRNSFGLDLFGERGSAHIDCLCKWGPSTLTVRKRVLPSGRPEETVEVLPQGDPTWQLEYEYFLELCRTGGTNLENDIWIYEKIRELGALIAHGQAMIENQNASAQKPVRAVILGGGGFIGGAAARRLQAEGIEVAALGRSSCDLLAPDAATRLSAQLRPDDVLVFVSAHAPVKNVPMLMENLRMGEAVCAALAAKPVAHVVYHQLGRGL